MDILIIVLIAITLINLIIKITDKYDIIIRKKQITRRVVYRNQRRLNNNIYIDDEINQRRPFGL